MKRSSVAIRDIGVADLNHLCAAVGDAEAGHDLVEHQESSVLGAQLAATLEELRGGLDEARVTDDGFEDDGSNVTALDELFNILQVVVGGDEGVLGRPLGDACGDQPINALEEKTGLLYIPV